MPVNLYYTQKVRGFQQESVKYSKESAEIRLNFCHNHRQAKDSYHARMAFYRWCKLAEETGIPELKTMAGRSGISWMEL